MSDITIDSTLESYRSLYFEKNEEQLIPNDRTYRESYEELLRHMRYDPVFHEEDKKLLLGARQNIELIEVLMKYGKNSLKMPALYNATLHRDSHAVEVLVKAGAHVTEETLSLAKSLDSPVLMHILTEIKSIKVPHHYGFSVTRKENLFSIEFNLDSKEIEISSVKRTKISIRPQYFLEGLKGIQCRGIGRAVSMGWDKDLDIYDDKDTYLGRIEGEILSTEDAKFSIYNEDGDKVGIAYLDDNKTDFTIVHADHCARVIAHLKRDTPDVWKMKVYQGDDIDPRILKLLSVFVVDSQI
jgi:hypothetical protein